MVTWCSLNQYIDILHLIYSKVFYRLAIIAQFFDWWHILEYQWPWWTGWIVSWSSPPCFLGYLYIWMVWPIVIWAWAIMGPTCVYTPKYWTAQQKKDEFLSLPGPWTLLTLLSYHIANVWPNNGKRGSKVCPQCGVYSKPYLDWFMQETTGFTAVPKYRIKPWCFFPVNQFWGEHQNHIQQLKTFSN